MGVCSRLPRRFARENSPISPQGLIEDVAVEKHGCIQCLVLSSRHHMPLHRQVSREGIHLGGFHAGGVPDPIETDEVAFPPAIGLLVTWAIARHPHSGLCAVYHHWWLPRCLHTVIFSLYGYTYRLIGEGRTRKKANPARVANLQLFI